MRTSLQTSHFIVSFLLLVLFLLSGCDATRHLKDNEYLLRSNNLKLRTDKGITRRGEFKDNIGRLIVQKPNTYFLGIPWKVGLYNIRYKKYEKDPSTVDLSSKTIERPVVFDSSLVKRSVLNLRGYLLNQGYYYPSIKDTVRFKNQKAYVTYEVNTGLNYLIKTINLDVDDAQIAELVKRSLSESVLQAGKEFANSMLETERSRITAYMKENGYYKFTNQNIRFEIDTFKKDFSIAGETAFETAINFITLNKKQKKPTLNVDIIIRAEEDPKAYKRYAINRVSVFPDFVSREDAADSSLKRTVVQGVNFRYHRYYIREGVILKNMFLEHGRIYSQSDYDATINRLNQLGVFQSVRVVLAEDTAIKDENLLNAFIILSPADKYDFTTSLEFSTGTTYFLGITPAVIVRDKNLAKGANLLTVSVSGGIETYYDSKLSKLSILTKNFGFNTSIDFPKFIVPFNQRRFSRKNLPRTIISFGTNLLDRVDYFTLTNTSANFAYNWKETQTKTWDVSPAFVNIIRLPKISDSFNKRLANNQFLKNSYRENFIEGENVSFTFSNQVPKKNRSYYYLKLSGEEAGGLLAGVNGIIKDFNFNYAQYLKFDFDARRYLNGRRSQLAARFYGGVGIPYGKSPTLPYIKQYFVGGAYSIRGWRIRTLGPGSYFDSTKTTGLYIDRTGDMKLEMNGEFRFDVIQLFRGAIKMKGAMFADAGNIWLTKPSSDYPNGEFAFSKLGRDIALSTGLGARLDIASFFIFRIDVAFPLKKPYETTGGGWVVKQINFGKRDWRTENLVVNFAIGYPF